MLSIWRNLFDPAMPSDNDDADDHPSIPEGMTRVHIFAGNFDTEEALLAYCFDSPSDDTPEPINVDLPGAFVDTTYVATGYANAVPVVLAEFFSPAEQERLRRQIGARNSIVVMSEYAFGGFPYELDDTPKLEYLGAQLVPLPQ